MGNQQSERLAVLLDGLDPHERRAWLDQIERSLHTCGCDEGGAGLLLGLAAMIVAVVCRAAWLPDGWWRLSLLVLGGAVAGAIVGKIVGKARGRYRARRLMAALAARLA